MESREIIVNICHTEISRKLVEKILAILIDLVKKRGDEITYGQLSRRLGYEDGRFSGIGKQLGYVQDVIHKFAEITHEDIPTLNGLVVNAKSHLPSVGFDYVLSNYNKLTNIGKKEIVEIYNQKAFQYENWDWVMCSLGLTYVSDVSESEDKIRKGGFGGGEGEEHRLLKEYIAMHPEVVGLESGHKGVNEHILLSGDRLDVFFPDSNSAVEVKPEYAPESDVLRGIYQCVKYKAVLEAECVTHGLKKFSNVVLALGGKLSVENRCISEILQVQVVDNIVSRWKNQK